MTGREGTRPGPLLDVQVRDDGGLNQGGRSWRREEGTDCRSSWKLEGTGFGD